jgi:hypothetical protein
MHLTLLWPLVTDAIIVFAYWQTQWFMGAGDVMTAQVRSWYE